MNANGRRLRQAMNNFGHWAKRQRPNYKKRDASASAKRLAAIKAKEQLIAHRKGMSKK